MTILHLDFSILGDQSVSRRISAAIVARLVADGDAGAVTHRDYGADPLPHLSGADLAARGDGHAEVPASDPTLAEFLGADTLVIGCPMYNFGVPSALKAWVDRILVAGKTFRYTETGPQGLAGGKRVIVAAARGGFYGPGAPFESCEHQTSYLRAVFAFLGIPEIEVIAAEGLAMGPDKRAEAIDAALAAAAHLAA